MILKYQTQLEVANKVVCALGGQVFWWNIANMYLQLLQVLVVPTLSLLLIFCKTWQLVGSLDSLFYHIEVVTYVLYKMSDIYSYLLSFV